VGGIRSRRDRMAGQHRNGDEDSQREGVAALGADTIVGRQQDPAFETRQDPDL
jgi:hypothetical protein